MTSALQDSAMLVSLNIAQWTARKHDKSVSSEVESKHGAHDAGRFNKMLVEKESLQPIGKIVTAARDHLYAKTLPWGENGERLLPASLFMDFGSSMRTFESEFHQRVDDFVRQYPALVQNARKRLGTMYVSADYPDVNEIRRRFGYSITILPVPTANDFRVQLSSDHVDSIKRSITREMEARQVAAVKDCYIRVRTVVSRMHERLSDEKAIFKDSLIGNARELLEVLPALNLTSDAELTSIAAELNDILVPPDRLRQDVTLRNETAAKADAILARMKGLM